MFEFRQERFDEIHEAETRFFNRAEPLQPEPIVQPRFQLRSTAWKLMIGCYVFCFGAAVAPVGAVTG